MTTINNVLDNKEQLAILHEVQRCTEDLDYREIQYTTKSMFSDSWIERLYCEYWQTRFRYEKLYYYPKKDKLMIEQCSVMNSYLQILRQRLINIGFKPEVLDVD